MNNTAKIDLFEARSLEEVPDLLEHWQMSNMQIDPGQASCSVRSADLGNLVVTRTSESHGNVANYAVQDGTTVFHFTNPRNLPTIWCGIELPHEYILINPSGRDYINSQRGSFDVMSIQVSNELLVAQQVLPEGYLMPGEISKRWMIPLGDAGIKLRSWLFALFSSKNRLSKLFSSAEFNNEFKELILQSIGEIFENESDMQITNPEQLYRRLHLAKLAQDLISGQPEEFRLAAQLANELNISPRALRKLFNDIFQTSPYQYMLSYRLQCVRRELNRHSASASTISNIATKFGFDELGRFSQYYRRMYGELPSATLNAQ